jgi:hypothetical protein
LLGIKKVKEEYSKFEERFPEFKKDSLKVITKKATPLLASSAMIRRVTQYPITKDEILNYLLKI